LSAFGYSDSDQRQWTPSVAIDFKVGYGLTEQYELFLVNKTSWFLQDTLEYFYPKFNLEFGGIVGAGLRYNVSLKERSMYFSWGGGLAYQSTLYSSGTTTGYGLFADIGYHWSAHWAVEFGLLYGNGDKFGEFIAPRIVILANAF